jgi:MtrB/PioB family decaheme-associated outer membrane protein
MNSTKTHLRFWQGIVPLVLAAAFGPASAEGEDVAQFIKPSSSVSVGLGAASGSKEDRAFFGQYNGMRKNSGLLLLDIDVTKRDDASGTWTNFDARNLGSENRELRFSQQKQGDWKYFFEYGELVRNYSNTVNTNVTGIGTNNLVVNTVGNPLVSAGAAALLAAQGTGSNVDLKTTRKGMTFGADKWLTPNLQLEASFKNEEKKGARMFGRVATCSFNNTGAGTSTYGCLNAGGVGDLAGTATTSWGALLMLPEPINSTIRQFELKLNYHDDKLAVNGGYYGSFYTNKYGSLNVTIADPTNMWNPNGTLLNASNANTGNLTGILQQAIALPPDNQSHQLSLAGTYAFTPTTRATFKFAYTHGTQKENFDSMGLTGGPRGSMDAVVDTTVAQLGISAKPMPKLSVLANLRYEQKSDKSPIDLYRTSTTTAATAGLTNTNSQGSHTKVKGKLEASYQLPEGYRATGGIDYDFRDLGRPTGTNDTSGQASAIRAKNDEIGYRGELRKSLSDTLNGNIVVAHSARNGSKWMTATNGIAPTVAEGTQQGTGFQLFPLFWMDLKRDKLKGSVDWAATNALNFQASAEVAAEHYFAPTMRGARDGKSTALNLDAAYAISDKWKMNGWYSRNDTILDINGTTNAYMAGMRQLGHNLGIGVRGAPTGQLELGADFTFSYEVNRTGLGVIGTSTQPAALPTAAFRQLNLNIFGKYALDKSTDIKVTLAHQRYYSNEWYWNNDGVNFFFSDGTTVTQKNQQNVSFIGAAYIYKFQ